MELQKHKLNDFLDGYGDGLHGTPAYSDDGIYFFINGNNLENNGIQITSDTLRISEDEYQKIKRPLTNNTILLSINGTLGKLAFYNGEKIALGKSACFLNIRNDVDKRYIKYVLSSKEFKKYMLTVASGSTIKNFAPKQAAEYEFFAPDLPTQKKIADVLSCIDDKIALNNKTNAELEYMAKTIYDYWFTQFDFPDKNGHPYKTSGGQMVYNETLKREIPAGWKVKRLNDFGEFKNGINYDPEEIGDTKVKIINVRNITESTVFFTPEKFDELLLKAKDIQKYLTDDNDIFIARSGTPGATRLLPPDQKDTIFCGFIIRFKVFEKIKKNFLFFSIKQFENQTNTQAAGTILKNVSQDTLKDIYLFEPPAYVLQTFNSEISTIFNLQLKTKNENEELTKLRDYLVPLLMNGQIEVR